MILLLIVLAILLLILLLKLGVDAAYDTDGIALSVLIGPIKIRLLPKKEKHVAQPKKAKAKKNKPKKNTKDSAESESKEKTKKALDLPFLFDIVKLGLQALNRFRICLRVEIFHLRFISASDDPYKTAMNCAYATTALNLLAPQAKRAFKVRDSRIEIGTDFCADKPLIDARIALTITVWRVLYVALTFGFAFLLRWYKHTRQQKKKAAAQSDEKAAAGTDANSEHTANIG